MENVKILDCTLRDGGRIINCKFPDTQTKRMVYSLTQAGIDIVEVGFLRDWHNTQYNGNSTFFTSVHQITPFLPQKRTSMYVAFVDFGMFDFESLEPYDGTSIDGIRFGFTKKDFDHSLDDIIKYSKLIKEKGYKLFLQSVNSLNYTDLQLLGLVHLVNELEPYSFGIVDTYGAMYIDDVQRLYTLIDHNLKPDIAIDFHSHNNYQLSFSLAQEVIKLSNGVRTVIIDATLRGMGKGAGNTNTELIVDYLVRKKDYSYNLEKILELIDIELYDLYEAYHWGYSPASFMAGIYRSHPNNIIYLLNKYSLSTNDIKNILSMLTPEERERYLYSKIDALYEQYRFKSYDDKKDIQKLKEIIGNKTVLILAPGNSIHKYKEQINAYIKEASPLIISVNFVTEEYKSIPFFGNQKRYYTFCYDRTEPVIVTSDLAIGNSTEIVVSLKGILSPEQQEYRSSIFLLLNILKNLEVRHIAIAGMDGYTEKAEDNYYDSNMMVRRTMEEIKDVNLRLQNGLNSFNNSYKNCGCLEIITPSIFKISN